MHRRFVSRALAISIMRRVNLDDPMETTISLLTQK